MTMCIEDIFSFRFIVLLNVSSQILSCIQAYLFSGKLLFPWIFLNQWWHGIIFGLIMNHDLTIIQYHHYSLVRSLTSNMSSTLILEIFLSQLRIFGPYITLFISNFEVSTFGLRCRTFLLFPWLLHSPITWWSVGSRSWDAFPLELHFYFDNFIQHLTKFPYSAATPQYKQFSSLIH